MPELVPEISGSLDEAHLLLGFPSLHSFNAKINDREKGYNK